MAEIVPFEQPQPGGFVETETALNIMSFVHRTRMRGWLSALVGAPGVGKTCALQHYAELHPNQSFYMSLTAADASLSGILDKLMDAVGAYNVAMGANNKLKSIVFRIRSLGGGPSVEPDPDRIEGRIVLLCDEAQHLSPAALESLRGIHDQTGVAIVLAGNPLVTNQLYVRRGEVKPAFAQLDRRIVLRRQILSPLPGDVIALAQHHGISGAREIAFLKRLAAFGHGLALPVNVIREARLAACNRSIGVGELEEAARSLGVDLS